MTQAEQDRYRERKSKILLVIGLMTFESTTHLSLHRVERVWAVVELVSCLKVCRW